MKRLNTPRGIDPFLYNSLPIRTVVSDGIIKTEYQNLYFFENPYRDGTEVEIFTYDRFLSCQSITEIEEERKKREKLREEKGKAKIKAIEIKRLKTREFNESLNIPVLWQPEIKHVLSGLTGGSNGSGFRRNTQVHIYLLEEISSGRLKRTKNSFLCKPSKGAHYNELICQSGSLEELQVSCKHCLQMARKHWGSE